MSIICFKDDVFSADVVSTSRFRLRQLPKNTVSGPRTQISRTSTGEILSIHTHIQMSYVAYFCVWPINPDAFMYVYVCVYLCVYVSWTSSGEIWDEHVGNFEF